MDIPKIPHIILAILVAAIAGLILLYIAVLHPNTARIVDCVPGYHNMAGPESDCVK
jgi:hypothetical protein